MTAGLLREAVAGLAAAGLLASLTFAGSASSLVALGAALVAIAAGPRWLPRLDLPAAAVAVTWLASTQLAPLPGATAMPALTCVLVACGVARLPPRIARVLLAGGLVIAVLVLALVAAFGLATIGEPRLMAYPGLDGWGGYPEMGLLGLVTIPITLSLALGPGPRDARIGAVVATICAAAGVVLSESRAAWAAALVGAILVVAVDAGRRRRAAAMAGAGLAGLLLAVSLSAAPHAQTPGAEGTLDVAAGSRLAAWGRAFDLWRERPLLGWGPSSYRRVYASRHQTPAADDAQFHAHNQYLHVAVETGVLGVASALWFGAAVLAGPTRRRDSATRVMTAAAQTGIACSLIAVAVRFIVDYFDPAGAGTRVLLWLSMLAGLRFALAAADHEPTRAPSVVVTI